MAWIKRNLLFTIGGVVALLLLGAAAFYNYQGLSHNSTAFDTLNAIYSQLQTLASEKPAPGNAKINNIQTAKDQEVQVRQWIDQTKDFFKPIPPIPDLPVVTSEAFAAALRRTIDQLNHDAERASVQLPPNYSFSFEAQRMLVRFAPGSLAPLSVQLGEVKTLAGVLFAARVNALDGIQRVRASEDDIAGSQSDYNSDVVITNEMAILTPYVVTFRSFTPELAAVMAAFAASPNGIIIKGLNVSPAGVTTSMGDAGGMPGGFPRGEGYMGGGYAPPANLAQGSATGKGGLTTFLNEQLLRITMEVVIVKPLPKK